jgi:hypothetical protein
MGMDGMDGMDGNNGWDRMSLSPVAPDARQQSFSSGVDFSQCSGVV